MGANINIEGDDSGVMVEMNTTPLIDVLLVLIIMLIITIPIQTHAVKMDMPDPNPQSEPPLEKPEVVRLEVDFDGTLTWNGAVIPDGDTLIAYLTSAARKTPQPELHLRPNKLAKYDVVAKVLATAQRVGVTNIGIVGGEQFLD